MRSTSSNVSPIRYQNILRLIVCVLLLVPAISYAQETSGTPKLKDVLDESAAGEIQTKALQKNKLVKMGPDDEYDRGVPRSAVAGYFAAVKQNDLKRAAEYLDLRQPPGGYRKSDGPELARQLKVILDRALWVDMELLSPDPKGHPDDGLSSYYDLVGQIQAGDKKYNVLLQRLPRDDGTLIWKFSKRTVRYIPAMYKAHGYGKIGEKLSQIVPSFSFLGLAIWQWVFLILVVAVVAAIAFPIVRAASWVVRRKQYPLSELFSRFINGPFYVLLILIIARNNFDIIHPTLTARAVFEASTIFIAVGAWMLIRLAGLFREYWTHRLKQQDRDNAIVLLRPAFATLNILILFFAVLIWLDNIGFRVTTVLAGLGIGGIAVALATQKSIENFIGALTLFLSAPVRVGDLCRIGDQVGIVEEIGLRATKLRTLEQSLVIVPNAEFSSMQIENLTGRKSFRFNPTIRLRTDTSPDQVRRILIEFQRLLYAHSKVAEAPLRARFGGFGEFSLDISIHCYVDTTDFNEYLAVAEDLNLRIMEIISDAGSEIAIPASIEYQAALQKPDDSAKQTAEKTISQQRDKNGLVPDLTTEQINKIRNTIPFPD
ncbi:MAG: mechanosensitive ion channel family protein [Acidiferrobacterales bacterium]